MLGLKCYYKPDVHCKIDVYFGQYLLDMCPKEHRDSIIVYRHSVHRTFVVGIIMPDGTIEDIVNLGRYLKFSQEDAYQYRAWIHRKFVMDAGQDIERLKSILRYNSNSGERFMADTYGEYGEANNRRIRKGA
jgi:hypothetical protein